MTSRRRDGSTLLDNFRVSVISRAVTGTHSRYDRDSFSARELLPGMRVSRARMRFTHLAAVLIAAGWAFIPRVYAHIEESFPINK